MEFPSEDKMGFAVPSSTTHSLRLLNHYMRTDLLRSIHENMQRVIQQKLPGSPLKHLVDSLTAVIEAYDGIRLSECVKRNPFHYDVNYKFQAEEDYNHDIRLMRHHLLANSQMLREITNNQL